MGATSQISRRASLRLLGLSVGLGAVASTVAACSTKSQPTGAAPQAPSGTGTVRWANWPALASQDDLDRLRQTTGVSVDLHEVINDMDSFVASIQPQLGAGISTGYDVATLDATQIRRFANRGQLVPFDAAVSQQLRDNALPAFVASWDPDFKYHCPYSSTTFSIGYSQRRTGRAITRIEQFLAPDLQGHVGLWSGFTETYCLFSSVLRLRGEINNTPDTLTLDDVRKTHDFLMPYARNGQFRIVGSDYLQGLSSGDLHVAFVTAVDVRTLKDPDINFSYAAEGSMQVLDNLVIPKGSESSTSATAFLKFWADPANAARLMIGMGFQPTLKGEADIAIAQQPELAADALVVPPQTAAIFQYPSWNDSDLKQIAQMWEQLTGR